jgi:PPOX class probable F420-dependent enzyme
MDSMPTPDDIIPADYRRLLELPLYGHLGTIRPDDTVQVTPMWFEFDGEHIRFTHTTYRQKYRNLHHNPSMALSILDPDNPFRYLEVAGRLAEVVPDPEGRFYVRLQNRYGNPSSRPPRDKVDRVILVMSVDRATKQ